MRIESIKEGDGYTIIHYNHEDMAELRRAIKEASAKYVVPLAEDSAETQRKFREGLLLDREEDKI